MNIFLLKHELNKYRILGPKSNESYRAFESFNGVKIKNRWTPVKIEVYEGNAKKVLPLSDFISWHPCVPVFSENAINLLGDTLRLNGEILPLKCSEGNYFAYNVTKMIKAIDLNKSEIDYFDDGEIMDIRIYEFIPKKVSGLTIFKILEIHNSPVYVTNVFVDQVIKNQLTGSFLGKFGETSSTIANITPVELNRYRGRKIRFLVCFAYRSNQ